MRELCYQPASAVAAGHPRGSQGAQGGCQQPLWPKGSLAATLRLRIKGSPGTWGGPSGFFSPWRRANPLVSDFHQHALPRAPSLPGPGTLVCSYKSHFMVFSPEVGSLRVWQG